MSAWDEIIRLSKGSVKDKINAIQSTFSALRQFQLRDIETIVRELGNPSEPEAVRVKLATGIEAPNITMRIIWTLDDRLLWAQELLRRVWSHPYEWLNVGVH